MIYALIDSNNRLVATQDMGEGESWVYPDDFTLVEADGFEIDPRYEYADYVYVDGEFVLDPQPKAEETDIDAIVAAKVDEALLKAERRVMEISSAQVAATKI